MIEIKKSDDVIWFVPHRLMSELEWKSTGPVSVDVVISELRSRGAHQTDIGDALHTANPDLAAQPVSRAEFWPMSRRPRGAYE